MHLAADNGYQIVDSVLAPSEVLALGSDLDAPALGRSRAGARHLMQHPAVARVASDERLLAIARQWLGSDAIPYRATLFDKSPARNWLVVWHQDTALPIRVRRDAPEWGPWSTKAGITYAHAPASALTRVVALRLQLDDSHADNGPLRVLPGTHTLGVLTEVETERVSAEVAAVDCLTSAGGIVVMRPLLVHASSKAESDRRRRVLHIEYAESLELDGQLLAIA